jgi:hypothetical protein
MPSCKNLPTTYPYPLERVNTESFNSSGKRPRWTQSNGKQPDCQRAGSTRRGGGGRHYQRRAGSESCTPASKNSPAASTTPSRTYGTTPANNQIAPAPPILGWRRSPSSSSGPSEAPTITPPTRRVPTRASSHTRPPSRSVQRAAPTETPSAPSHARSLTRTTVAAAPKVEYHRSSIHAAPPPGPSQRYQPSRSAALASSPVLRGEGGSDPGEAGRSGGAPAFIGAVGAGPSTASAWATVASFMVSADTIASPSRPRAAVGPTASWGRHPRTSRVRIAPRESNLTQLPGISEVLTMGARLASTGRRCLLRAPTLSPPRGLPVACKTT